MKSAVPSYLSRVFQLYWFACILFAFLVVVPPVAWTLARFYLLYLAPWPQYLSSVIWTVTIDMMNIKTVVSSGELPLPLPLMPEVGFH